MTTQERIKFKHGLDEPVRIKKISKMFNSTKPEGKIW
jgi:hypothetical protein